MFRPHMTNKLWKTKRLERWHIYREDRKSKKSSVWPSNTFQMGRTYRLDECLAGGTSFQVVRRMEEDWGMDTMSVHRQKSNT